MRPSRKRGIQYSWKKCWTTSGWGIHRPPPINVNGSSFSWRQCQGCALFSQITDVVQIKHDKHPPHQRHIKTCTYFLFAVALAPLVFSVASPPVFESAISEHQDCITTPTPPLKPFRCTPPNPSVQTSGAGLPKHLPVWLPHCWLLQMHTYFFHLHIFINMGLYWEHKWVRPAWMNTHYYK